MFGRDMVVRALVGEEKIAEQKEQLSRIVQRLMGMLRKFSGHSDFLREAEGRYSEGIEHEHEHDYERGEHDE